MSQTVDTTLLRECLSELEFYMINGILTSQQYTVFKDKLHGHSYESVMQHHGLCNNSLIHCLIRTSEGRKWYKGMPGGGQTYLTDIDMIKFATLAEQASDELNCLSTPNALSLAVSLKKERLEKAKFLLRCTGCSGLISHLPEHAEVPSKMWLKEFCATFDINVSSQQSIEAIRRSSCDVSGIMSFFSAHSILLDRHPALVLNMDETMLSARRKYKVLCAQNKLPLTPSASSYPHLTGVVTISAIGKCFDPMLILPNKKTRRGLEEYDCFITSSPSGWMTKRLFLIYVIHIISQIQIYRLSLPESLKHESFLLTLDGHCSRHCFYACLLLALFDIDLLVLPAHASHIIQPIDVSITGPLKAEFAKELQGNNFRYDFKNIKIDDALKLTSPEMRNLLIESFLAALRKSTTKSNIRSGFQKSGLAPLDPSIPLQSKFIMPKAIAPKKTNFISSKFLNSEESLLELFRDEFKRDYNDSDAISNISEFIANVFSTNDESGICLSTQPCVLVNHPLTEGNLFISI